MATESITLSGSALLGVEPHLLAPYQLALPAEVKLGRIRPPARPPAPRLACYFDAARMATPPPASINRRAKAGASLAHMYLNDRYGDCVIAGKAHALGLWSAADSDSGGEIIAMDGEILSQYRLVCGPNDQGCNISSVLGYMREQGFLAGGKRYLIDGFVACDWTNQLETKIVQFLFGASCIGINLPQAWTQNAVWDVTNTQIVGGHDVTPIDYDETGVYVSSWGRIYLITWAAWTSTRWLEEYYALLAPAWYNHDQLAPCGIDAVTLKADLAKLAAGTLPPIDPTPGPTPVCPAGQHWDATVGMCVSDTPPPPGPLPSPECTTAKTIFDNLGHTWTLVPASPGSAPRTLRDGVWQAGGYAHPVQGTYLWTANTLYVLGTDLWWYRWSGADWHKTTTTKPACIAPPPPPPPPAPPPGRLFSVSVPSNVAVGGSISFPVPVPVPAGTYDWSPTLGDVTWLVQANLPDSAARDIPPNLRDLSAALGLSWDKVVALLGKYGNVVCNIITDIHNHTPFADLLMKYGTTFLEISSDLFGP